MKKKIDFWVYSFPALKKLIMELKIAFLIIVASVTNVFSIPSYSQVAKVSLDFENIRLEQVMDEIERQSEFYFIFNQKQIDVNRVVSIQAEDKLITDILPELFSGTNVNYAVLDRKILLTIEPLGNSLPDIASETELQQTIISGTITDAVTKDPMPGVNILIKGTTIGALTDVNGKYTLTITDQNNVILVFSFIGYSTQEVPVAGKSIIDVALEAQLTGLDEVVVIGYGTVKRADLTGSVGSISSATLQEVKVTTVGEALLGKIAGVQIKPRDGTPGSSPQIIIRGVGSISAGSTPLYVVDGFPVSDLESLNPDNIESIDILKDASATAIYGSRGSNGVVIINTKRGQTGKTQIMLDVSTGLQKVTQTPHYNNAREQADFAYWGAYFRNLDDGNDTSGPPETWKFKMPQMVLDIRAGKPGTPDVNWIDAVLRVAPISRYHLSSIGGNDIVKFAISGEYLNQEGIILGSSFKRYSLQANIDGQLTKRLAIKVNLNPSFSQNAGENPQGTGYGTTILGNAASIGAYTPIWDANGNYFVVNGLAETGNFPNPVALANEIIDQSSRARFIGNINTEYTILDNLKFNVMIGGSYSASKGNRFVPVLPSLLNAAAFGRDNASLGLSWISEYTLNYNKSFGDHQIVGLAGFTAEGSKSESNSFESNKYPNNIVPYLDAAGGIITAGGAGISEWSLVSYLARVNYIYGGRYYLTGSIRTDGSSRFGSENKYGVFPSIALAWRISEENFLKDVSFINNLKLRVSYGQTGNNNIGNYAALATVSNVNYPWGNSPIGGFVLNRIPNPTLTWEKQGSFNTGVDVSFFKGRLNLTVDNFKTINKSLLLNVNIPTITGFGSALQNLGEVENKGWEFLVNTVNSKGKFEWTTDFNISFYKNKVLALGPEGDPIISSQHITMIGQPMGMFWGWVMDGIFETQAELDEGPIYNPGAKNRTRLGDAKFKDFSGTNGVPDGKIDSYDKVIIGNPYPDFYYGMTNHFNYQNFSLGISFQGVYGNKLMSQAKFVGLRSEFRVAQLALSSPFWTSPESPGNGNNPRPNDEPTGGIRETSTRHLEDGSYLRVNNISLSYTVPSNVAQKLRLNSARVYVNATNPFIISNTEGFNPDVNSSNNSLNPGLDENNYPLPKTLSFGINLGF